jgi:hypothetical protein
VAVTASLAVPGLFHHVVLKSHKNHPSPSPEFRHLSDGGVADNLGLTSLLMMLESVKDGRDLFPNGCYLIGIDASPDFLDWKRTRAETREFPQDYLFDRNASDAVDYVLLHQREQNLRKVGINNPDADEFGEWTSLNGTLTCKFWNIALRHIHLSQKEKNSPLGNRWDTLPWQKQIRLTPTELNIWDWQQQALFEAAHELVDKRWKATAHQWFERR